MRRLFNIDSPMMQFLAKVADIMILNILFLLCSLPFFTIGASATALYYVTLKMNRGEEGYIIRDFFKSFKLNFKQATIIWMIFAVILGFIGFDLFIIWESKAGKSLIGAAVVMIPGLFILFTLLYVFPLLARFENTVKNTIKNALLISIANTPKTIGMLVFSAILLLIPLLNGRLLPMIAICSFSAAAYGNSAWLNGIFAKLEPEQEPDHSADEDEGIFEGSRSMESENKNK